MDEGNENLVCPSLWDFKRSFTYPKILRHGTSGFTSHPKEGVLRIFIALKNPSPWPGLNPRPLGPVANTLTTFARSTYSEDSVQHLCHIHSLAVLWSSSQADHFAFLFSFGFLRVSTYTFFLAITSRWSCGHFLWSLIIIVPTNYVWNISVCVNNYKHGDGANLLVENVHRTRLLNHHHHLRFFHSTVVFLHPKLSFAICLCL
jgi:hypothetical protein